ncbi:MAG TPA: hypothetical protein VM261_33930 [Kofleriaceae bacterium]|nr:hypothetical protein [Kofleriaceae bacterium]
MPRRSSWDERVDARLGNTVNEVFLKIPTGETRKLFKRLSEEAEKEGIVYQDDDGTVHPVPIMARPRIIRPEQEQYFHKVCLDLTRALEKLASLYIEVPAVRALLPFTEREERWLRDIWAKVGKQPQTVVARLDANADFASDDWSEGFDFFETNSVGVGGMYYAPKAAEIVQRVVVPAMQKRAPALVLKPQDDMRQLLLEQITMHAKAIKKRRINTAFLQERDAVGGPNEFPYLVEYFKAQGVPAALVDPRELRRKGDELYAGDLPIDLVYRDAEIGEYVALEEDGADMGALHHAFMKNQVVSSIAGEFDHKSTFEVLTSPELSALFTAKQQKIFRKHVLWTRIVRETKTTDIDGQPVDLLPWLRRNKDRVVLKPNRSFGGTGIVVGPHVDLAAWDEAIAEALSPDAAETGGVVAQRYVDVKVKDFPILSDGAVTLEEFYVVCGFLATPRGVGILGRASKKRVVNVGQKGGLTAVLVMV